MFINNRYVVTTCSLLLFSSFVSAQTTKVQEDGKQGNFISTAVPFLLIAPDSRGSSLGNSGVASSPDLNSAFWNASKLAQIDADFGISASYSPWLRKLYPGMYLANLAGFKKVGDYTAVGFSLNYFTLGKTDFKDESGYQNGLGYPNEYSLGASYAQEFGEGFSLGMTVKYIRSDLTNGQFYQGRSLGAGNDVAFDISLYYRTYVDFRNPRQLVAGFSISNIGPKIKYGYNEAAFLPTILRLGVLYGITLDQTNSFSFGIETTKLLVPTPPIYDSTGKIIAGKDPNRSVLSGMFGSFSDAPRGFKETLEEFSLAPSIEYTYNDQFSVRGGVYLENKNKGDRKFCSLGLGLKLKNQLLLDLAYLLPFKLYSPLDNTLQLSLGWQF